MTLNLLGATHSRATPLGPNQINSHTDFPSGRGRKREERIAVANEAKSLAELGVREVMRQVIASAQNAFVAVQQAKQNLSLVRENLKSLCTLGQKKPAATVPIKVTEKGKKTASRIVPRPLDALPRKS